MRKLDRNEKKLSDKKLVFAKLPYSRNLHRTLLFEIAEKLYKVKSVNQETLDNLDRLHMMQARDNEPNAEIVQILLEDNVARVTIMGDGKLVLGIFDVNLMDNMMSVMEKLTARCAIRSLDRADMNVYMAKSLDTKG